MIKPIIQVFEKVKSNKTVKAFLESKYGVSVAMWTAAAGMCVAAALVIGSSIGAKPVLELLYDGESLGFVESKEIYDIAKVRAEGRLASLHTVPYRFSDNSKSYRIVYRKGEVDYLGDKELADILVDEANNCFAIGYGLYVDGTLVAIGENREDVQCVLDEIISLYSELYGKVKTPDDIIRFNSSNSIQEISVPKNAILSRDEIRQVVGLDSLVDLADVLLFDDSITDDMTVLDITEMLPEYEEITYEDICLSLPVENVYFPEESSDNNRDKSEVASVSFKSMSTEVCREVLPCGEEIVEYDDDILEGKKCLIGTGVYGIKEVTYLIEYIDGVEITRTLVDEVIIKEPVAKKYKMGTKPRAEYEKEERARIAAEEAANTPAPVYVSAEPGETPSGASGSFMFPTTGTITSTFAGRTLGGAYEFHGALDIANKPGTPVYAADGGVVTRASPFSTYGNCIIIKHSDGLETLYAHLDVYCVKEGDVVGKGWKIAEMGSTGRVTGPHLHFEVRVNGERVDPLGYVSP